MRYLYYDLGEQEQASSVVAHLHGSAANVLLLDPWNFDRYRFGQPFVYTGGFCTRTPVQLEVPHDGHWHLVIDCGGYGHHVRARNIEVLTAGESPPASEAELTPMGAVA